MQFATQTSTRPFTYGESMDGRVYFHHWDGCFLEKLSIRTARRPSSEVIRRISTEPLAKILAGASFVIPATSAQQYLFAVKGVVVDPSRAVIQQAEVVFGGESDTIVAHTLMDGAVNLNSEAGNYVGNKTPSSPAFPSCFPQNRTGTVHLRCIHQVPSEPSRVLWPESLISDTHLVDAAPDQTLCRTAQRATHLQTQGIACTRSVGESAYGASSHTVRSGGPMECHSRTFC